MIKELLRLRIVQRKLNVKFVDSFFNNYFKVNQDVIIKISEDKTLKNYICDEQIRDAIYDDQFVYYCLCEITINKLTNSMEHTCSNCNSDCCGTLKNENVKDCMRWSHDFVKDSEKNLEMGESKLIQDIQREQFKRKTLKK